MRNTLLIIVTMVTLNVSAFASEHAELKAFPITKEGLERFIIVLPDKPRGEEDAFKVEIIVGKEMDTDGVNLVRLGSIIEPRVVEGWGYTYYEMTKSFGEISTMIAPVPGAEMVKTFVTATPLLIRYNSRLPIVVFAPEGYEVQYRIWESSRTTLKADKK